MTLAAAGRLIRPAKSLIGRQLWQEKRYRSLSQIPGAITGTESVGTGVLRSEAQDGNLPRRARAGKGLVCAGRVCIRAPHLRAFAHPGAAFRA